MGEIFDLNGEKIKSMCINCVNNLEPNIESLHREIVKERYSDNHNTGDNNQSYVTYLCWHALVIIAGKLYRARSSVFSKSKFETWKNWISDYRITRPHHSWISDGTQPYPLISLKPLSEVKNKGPVSPISDEDLLSSIIGIESKKFTNILVCGFMGFT